MMAKREASKKDVPKSAKGTKKASRKVAARRAARADEESKRFTDEERAAMRDRAKELKVEARASKNKADAENAVLATIADMPAPDRSIGERLHAIIRANAPALSPRLWYGMPAYSKEGKVVCFFQSAQKFKTRYATFGFMHEAKLDDGAMWPTAFALREVTAAEEAKIAMLLKKAVSAL